MKGCLKSLYIDEAVLQEQAHLMPDWTTSSNIHIAPLTM